MTLANKITLSRLLPLAAMLWIWFFLPTEYGYLSLPLYILCLVLDVADGVVARKRGEVTRIGAQLDPAIDFVSQVGIFLFLVRLELFPYWYFYLVLFDWFLGMSLYNMRTICFDHASAVGDLAGKMKGGFVDYGAVWLMVVYYAGNEYLFELSVIPALMYVSCAIAVYRSGLGYSKPHLPLILLFILSAPFAARAYGETVAYFDFLTNIYLLTGTIAVTLHMRHVLIDNKSLVNAL